MKRFFLSLLLLCSMVRASTTFAVNDATFQSGLSPYNWYTNGSTSVQAVNCGATISLKFTGTSFGVGVDVSGYVGAGIDQSNYPTIGYSVDGGAFSSTLLTSASTTVSLASSLSNTTHTVLVVLNNLPGSGASSRWTGLLSLIVTSAVVDTGKIILSPTKANGGWSLWYGDSITENINPTPILGWPSLLSQWLNVVWAPCAFSGQGWDAAPSGIPDFPDAYNLILSGHSRSFVPPPQYVFINQGQNGTADSTTIKTTLENIRTAVGPSTWIYLICPFSQVNVTGVTAGYTAYVAAHPTDKITLIDLGAPGKAIIDNVAYAPDGVHPNAAGCVLLANLLITHIVPLRAGFPQSSAVGF